MSAEDNRKVLDRLCELARLDVNAVYAYEQAIERIEERHIRQPLEHFQDEHEKHVEDLYAVIRSLGGEPPERKPDIKGYFLEALTGLRSSAGTTAALKALRAVEKISNRAYAQTRGEEWPEGAATLIRKHCEEESEHMRFLQEAVSAADASASRFSGPAPGRV